MMNFVLRRLLAKMLFTQITSFEWKLYLGIRILLMVKQDHVKMRAENSEAIFLANC